MVPDCLETSGLQAALEGIFPFQHIGGHMAQNGQIFRSMAFADPAVVFSERDIQAPGQIVFDAPVIVEELYFNVGDYHKPWEKSIII